MMEAAQNNYSEVEILAGQMESDLTELDLLASFPPMEMDSDVSTLKLPRRRRSRTRSTAVKAPAFGPHDGRSTAGDDGWEADCLASSVDSDDHNTRVVHIEYVHDSTALTTVTSGTSSGTSTATVEHIVEQVCEGAIHELNLQRRYISDEQLISIFDRLSTANITGQVRSVVLTRNDLADRSALAIANALSTWARDHFEELHLNQNMIGENGAQALLNALQQNRGRLVLRKIDLSWNGDITKETKLGIAKELLHNIVRIELTSGNGKGDTNVDSMQYKTNNKTYIPELYLHGQALGDDGIIALCKLLEEQSCLRRLYLGDNDIRDEGAEALLQLLESNLTLTHIDLEENYDLDPTFKERIGACLVRNRSLGSLYLQRYALAEGPLVHRSATSEVVFAKDVTTTPVSLVALKTLKHREDFEREIHSRFYDQRSEALQGHVMEVIGYHTCVDDDAVLPPQCTVLRRKDIPYSDSSEIKEERRYILVMHQGSRSLWQSLGSERIAGYNLVAGLRIAKEILIRLEALHSASMVHGDLKPRNMLFHETREGASLLLCDLDASLPSGSVRPSGLKRSTAYCPPELIRADIDGTPLLASPSFDIWSFGVVFFELLSGRHLFPQDIGDDNMVDEADLVRLAAWLCPNDDMLNGCCAKSTFASTQLDTQVASDVRCILRWCLQGSPDLRPTISQLLSQKLFGGPDTMPPMSALPPSTLPPSTIPLIEKSPARMKYHVFISHYQLEASGDVGTLYYLFNRLGISAWRDMNTSEITEAAMRQGVYDSDVFVLFLTNSTLSRYFCLKEIAWAIEFAKPIVVVVEQDDRFWPWDNHRWVNDLCARSSPSSPWTSGWIQNTYSITRLQHLEVVNMIEAQYNQRLMLPFRRREFELLATVHEMFNRVSCYVPWRYVPLTQYWMECRTDAARQIAVIADSSSAVVTTLIDELKMQFSQLSPSLQLVTGYQPTCSHVLLLLTGGLMSNSSCLTDLAMLAASAQQQSAGAKPSLVFVHSAAHGWNFGAFYNQPDSDVKRLIASNEALALRTLDYERRALLLEILRRMP